MAQPPASNGINSAQVIGSARGVGAFPIGDGSFWEEIHGFMRDERGLLRSRHGWQPLIPDEWRSPDSPPAAFSSSVLGMVSWKREGIIPEILILTADATSGVYRYAPWRRAAGGTNPGLEEVKQWTEDGAAFIASTGRSLCPASMVVGPTSVFFTFGDRAGVWEWDGDRLLPVGFTSPPAAPHARGPNVNADGPNSGGFSVTGRIGTTDGSWTDDTGAAVGGLDNGLWRYYVVSRHINGAYSPMSVASPPCTIRREMASATVRPDELRRGFRVHGEKGPPQTAAKVYLRTPNLRRLGNLTPEPRFLLAIEGNFDHADFVDTLADGELGPIWLNREAEPSGTLLLAEFDSCLLRLNTYAHPARMYFSERTQYGPAFGSIAQGNWLDIHPSSGPITGAIAIPWQGQATSVLLVFKETCTRVVSGAYPLYQEGTFCDSGMPGPKLVQLLPDGALVWFDGLTFRRYTVEEGFSDLGSPIRRKLKRVDTTRTAFGVSYHDSVGRCAVFVLPVRGSDAIDYKFIWDYEANTWRHGQDIGYNAVLTLTDGTILIGGTLDDVPNVYIQGAYRPNYANPSFEWTLRTAWTPIQDGPKMDADGVVQRLVLHAEETGTYEYAAYQYKDWNHDNAVRGTVNDPEAATVSGYDPRKGDIPVFGTATFNTDVWRDPRVYRCTIPSNGIPAIVYQVELTGTEPLALLTVYGYARSGLATPGSRDYPVGS
jgi:hypothetical protein